MEPKALLLVAVLSLAPAAARAEQKSDFPSLLQTAAGKAPEASFELGLAAPVDFQEFLTKKSYSFKGGRLLPPGGGAALSNLGVSRLYAEFKGGAGAQPAAGKGAPGQKSKLPASLADIPVARAAASGGAFDGKKADAEKKATKGFRFGLEVGSGPHPGGENYAYKGIDDALDWDIAGRTRLDGLGARVSYRHPLPVVGQVSLSFLKYLDIAGAMGMSSASGELDNILTDTPGKIVGGYQISAATRINSYLGLNAGYDEKETASDAGVTKYQSAGPGVSLSPLGGNPGKPWNFTLTFSPEFVRQVLEGGAPEDDKKGLGYSSGVIFQHALDKLPIVWLQPPPKGNGVVWPDRAKASFYLAASEISSVALTWALETSIYITKHVEITPGARVTWHPAPKAGEAAVTPGPLVGLDLKNFDL